MHLRRRRRERAGPHRPAGVHERDLARFPARRPARHGVRLPRARPVRAGERAPLQPQQAGAGPLRQGGRRPHRLGAGAVRLRHGRGGHHVRRARQRAVHAQGPRHRPGLHLGRRPSAERAVGPDGALRDARQGLHQAASGRAGAAARHVPRPGDPGRGALHQGARRHQRGAAADPHVRRRQLPDGKGPGELLGLLHPRRSSPPAAATPACRTSRSPSSRRWSAASTRPGSR